MTLSVHSDNHAQPSVLGFTSLGNASMMGEPRDWAQGVCALAQLWSLSFNALFRLKLLGSFITSNKTVSKQLCKLFYFIPLENILFKEGCCAQLLHDAQNSADTAGLLNGHWLVFLHFFPDTYGSAQVNITEGLLSI